MVPFFFLPVGEERNGGAGDGKKEKYGKRERRNPYVIPFIPQRNPESKERK